MTRQPGDYVKVRDSGDWERAIVRNVSDDDRIIYVEIEGECELWRFSPDEVRTRA